jgi:hypothetical protein
MVCTLARPSTSARQSKQAPIMQNGPRGAPDTGVARVVVTPTASSATETLSAARAGTAHPSDQIVRFRRPRPNQHQSAVPLGSFLSVIAA